jgi:uncharacterized protein YbbK (DUF523 family)
VLSLLVSETFLVLVTKYGTENLEQRVNVNILDKSKETAIKICGEMFMTTK